MKNKKSKLKHLSDQLWAAIIRNKKKCEMCYAQNVRFNAHHIVSRANHSLRYDLRNGLCLCVDCHFNIAHRDPIAVIEFLKDERPDDLKHLQKEKRKISQLREKDYEDILERLRHETI